jgi:Fur family ferric uptake transcriptional regulator
MRNSFSPLRQEILSVVQNSDIPVSAKSIHSALKTRTALSTIYRALWYLESINEIDGYQLDCAPCGKDRYFVGSKLGHVHFFHCESCHMFIPVTGCSIAPSIENKYGVKIRKHVLYFTGECGSCAKKAKQK